MPSHANASDDRRTVITLWFQPDFASLPERVKAQMVKKTQQDACGLAGRRQGATVRALNPHYDGDAEPYGRDLYARAD